ncbi:glycosyltransferase family 2 protein [Tabrizicola sp.]|uniref:glycosyltransferase family 2 protein n=1 Tax=Tabrizicola sp. TaxID=2005166 RepID=UPI003D2BBB11
MTLAAASVIVVSRHRAAALGRCLLALAQQDHPQIEVIVVADPAGIDAAKATGLVLKLVAFDEANISAARNLGLGMASGEIVAFIDDDAVAEPTWLSRLCAAFGNPQVVAATGFVRGRNGISFQWKACEVDALGLDHPLPDHAATYPGTPTRAVKTQGTNCAFRREALLSIGGFDPALRFYLDEADVNLRLAGQGLTAVVPDAQVHHGFAASDRRREDRVPTSLHEIAASIAVFLRRHAPNALEAETIPAIDAQRRRVADLARAGRISGAEAEALLASLATGWDEGMARRLTQPIAIPEPHASFLPLPGTGPRSGTLLAGRIWQQARLLREAEEARAMGRIVSVICLSPTPRAHRMQFTDKGIWLQSGGLFGCSTRNGARFRLTPFSHRIAEEKARISAFRPVG